MDLGIRGKTALVTGASQGIGRAIAELLAKEGVRVGLVARRAEQLAAVCEGLEGNGHGWVSCDLEEAGAAQKTLTEFSQTLGHFDIAIHNVGGTLGVKDPLASPEEWARVCHFNAGIAIDFNRYLVPPMKEAGWGRILHVSSISAENLRGSAPYGAAKAYLNAYTKVLGRALAPDGIVVNALMPGAIFAPGGHWDEESEHNQKDLDGFLRKRSDFLRHHHAIGRLGTAEEIAPFALFMVSEQASFSSTSLVPIDGGTM